MTTEFPKTTAWSACCVIQSRILDTSFCRSNKTIHKFHQVLCSRFKLLQRLSHATAASSSCDRTGWWHTNSRIIQKLKNSDYDGVMMGCPSSLWTWFFKRKISTSFLTETHQLKKKLRRFFPKKKKKKKNMERFFSSCVPSLLNWPPIKSANQIIRKKKKKKKTRPRGTM